MSQMYFHLEFFQSNMNLIFSSAYPVVFLNHFVSLLIFPSPEFLFIRLNLADIYFKMIKFFILFYVI